ncbi:hypothetical protein AB0D08_08895 [Kitasatospora sp. NPDC048540]|uniref:hypothetical protein n=1 Tax=unclassified Kitasatospora TaxID=2633591 RepID=UPI00053994B3|nr:hypothetical protein [Kitasatospora sp. MBT63]
MVDLTRRISRPSRRAVRPGAVADPVRVPAVRRDPASAETGELVLTQGPPGGPTTIQWQRPGCPTITLAPPYRLDRVDLKGSYRARLHGLTAGVRLVCPDWSPLFLVAPAQLALLACAAATSRLPPHA